MMFSSDPIVDAMRHDMEIEREQEQLPVCDACGKIIDEDRFWRINGEVLCDDCATDMYTVHMDTWMDEQEDEGWDCQ